MIWSMVDGTINSMLRWRGPPAVILIHCGGNDICSIKNGQLLYDIKTTFYNLNKFLPNTLLIWSYILPRRSWYGARNTISVNKSRIRINRGVRSYLHHLGGKAIQHLDFEDLHSALFHDDGVHLSYIGNDIFINDLQSGLELFIKSPVRRLYPDEII